jgi:hypothetical protein
MPKVDRRRRLLRGERAWRFLLRFLTFGSDPATARPLPPGWDESHLDAYRDGFTDALLWARDRDPEQIEAVLDDEAERAIA